MKWPRIYYNHYTLKYEFVLEDVTKQSNQLVFNVDELFSDLDEGTVTIDAVDWFGETWEILKINNSLDMFEQSYCWIYPLLARVRDYDLRIEVLENLTKFSLCYIETFDKMYRFIDDCNAMIAIVQQLKQFPIPDYMLRKQGYDEKQWIKELTLVCTKTTLAPNMLMALAQERYNIDKQKKKVDKLSSIVLSIGYLQKFTIANCVDFCRYLYVAEGYRQFLICGDPDYDEVPTLRTLNRKLRNACFDIYIKMRFNTLKAEMDEDNTRLLDPTDAEVYNKLYEQEREFIEKERTNKTTEDIIILSSYLIEYLKLKLPETSKQQAKQSEIIQHDRKENHQFNEKLPTQEQLEKTFTYVYRNDKRAFYPHLIEFLLQEKDRTDHFADADWARHALVIYEQRPTILKHIPSTFAAWLKEFSKMFGRECKTMYEPGKIKKRRKSAAINFMPTNTTSSVG